MNKQFKLGFIYIDFRDFYEVEDDVGNFWLCGDKDCSCGNYRIGLETSLMQNIKKYHFIKKLIFILTISLTIFLCTHYYLSYDAYLRCTSTI